MHVPRDHATLGALALSPAPAAAAFATTTLAPTLSATAAAFPTAFASAVHARRHHLYGRVRRLRL